MWLDVSQSRVWHLPYPAKECLKNVTRTESIAVSLAVGILCPLLLFVFCWWVTAVLATYLPIPESSAILVRQDWGLEDA